MLCMLFLALEVDQDVINEHDYDFIQIWLAHLIHHIHEYRCRVDSSCGFDDANLYGTYATDAAPETKSIWNSTCPVSGNPGKSSGKTSGFIRFLTFSVSVGAPISAGDPNPAVTSISAGFSIFAASSIPAATLIATRIPIPAGDFIPAGHISFLLVVSHSCWYMTVTAG
nr:hypothetical protein [Tanacetum cinerariifolium]